MVSGQLIYFHLSISKELLIYLDHLKISRRPAKKTSGILLSTRLSEDLKAPLGGGGVSQRMREPVSYREHLVKLYQGGAVFPLAQPGSAWASPLLTWITARLGTGYAPGSFAAGSASLPRHLFIP